MSEEIEAGVETTDEGSVIEDEGVEADAAVSSAEGEKDTTDWKTIATNYKNALSQKRQFVKKGIVEPHEETDEDEDKPLTRKEFKSLLQQEVVPLVASSKEDSLLLQKIKDPSKRAFVKQLLESRIVRTGTSEEDVSNDIDDAIAMADRKKTATTISELKRAANNKPHAPTAGSSTEKPIEQKPYKWTASQAQALEKRAQTLGVDPEKFKKDAWDNQKKTTTA